MSVGSRWMFWLRRRGPVPVPQPVDPPEPPPDRVPNGALSIDGRQLLLDGRFVIVQ